MQQTSFILFFIQFTVLPTTSIFFARLKMRKEVVDWLQTYRIYLESAKGIKLSILLDYKLARLPNQQQNLKSIYFYQMKQKGAEPQKLTRLLDAAEDIIAFASKRNNHISHKRTNDGQLNTVYEQAKNAETSERNLYKAALLYADAACQGSKVDSCIKDFASILHQMGQTAHAVKFLSEARSYYFGDINKFDRLLQTLERQLNPSIKHQCKSLLIELPCQQSLQILSQMFQNTSRIRSCKFYKSLSLSIEQQTGKWMVLEFQSFSAAKKTLQKFREDNWFGVNKFWLKEGQVVCETIDGWVDFDGLVVDEQILQKGFNQKYSNLNWSQKRGDIQLMNYLAIRLIEQDIFFRLQELMECYSEQSNEL